MTRPDGLERYRRVFQRSRGINVPDPVTNDGGPEPDDSTTNVPGPQWGPNEPPGTTPTPNPPFIFRSPFEHQAHNPPPSPSPTPADALTAAQAPPPQFLYYDAQGGLTTPRPVDETKNAPPRSFDDIRRASTSQNNEDANKDDQHLGIHQMVDDAYSEASLRFKAKRSQYAASRSWRKAGGAYGSDSDRDDKGAKDGEDEAYDTDLDSQASQGGVRRPREHTRKMWKWKSLVANRYEHMLLECIVNIGTWFPIKLRSWTWRLTISIKTGFLRTTKTCLSILPSHESWRG